MATIDVPSGRLKRFIRYRDDGTVIAQDHKVTVIENVGSCSCGFTGILEDFEIFDGCDREFRYCPVVEEEGAEYLATLEAQKRAAGAVCTLCGKNWVDVMNGFDTCSTCQPRPSGRG